MTPQSLITDARYIINDTVVTYRVSDAELIGYFNDGVLEISTLQPSVFSKIGQHTCTVSVAEQTLAFSTAQAVQKVLAITNGAALTEFSTAAMDSFNPAWRTDTVGAAKQWGRYSGQILKFFVYPPAPATSQVLDILYTANPTALAIGDTITEVPSGYYPALVDYLVFRTESKDDEHANSGRSAAGYQMFVAKVKGV